MLNSVGSSMVHVGFSLFIAVHLKIKIKLKTFIPKKQLRLRNYFFVDKQQNQGVWFGLVATNSCERQDEAESKKTERIETMKRQKLWRSKLV